MMVEVFLDPVKRKKYISELLRLDNLSHVKEDPLASYCPVSLTSTPETLKPYIKDRQEQLKKVLIRAGIQPYDPLAADTFNPDKKRDVPPQEVYNHDSEKIVSARFFTGFLLLPNTGPGNEAEKARIYNRICVMFVDKNIRVSRMQPHRTIYLEYDNFLDHQDEFVEIFQMLQEYEPGMGLNNGVPVLLGFHKKTGDIVDLEELVYTKYPHLKYCYDGTVDIVKLEPANPSIFYEHVEE